MSAVRVLVKADLTPCEFITLFAGPDLEVETFVCDCGKSTARIYRGNGIEFCTNGTCVMCDEVLFRPDMVVALFDDDIFRPTCVPSILESKHEVLARPIVVVEWASTFATESDMSARRKHLTKLFGVKQHALAEVAIVPYHVAAGQYAINGAMTDDAIGRINAALEKVCRHYRMDGSGVSSGTKSRACELLTLRYLPYSGVTGDFHRLLEMMVNREYLHCIKKS